MGMIIKHYQLRAAEGSAAALRAALDDLGLKLAAIGGVSGVELYQDADDADRFIFIERWQSDASYAQGSKLIDKAAFKSVFAHLGAPPELAKLAAVSAGGVALAA